LRALFVIQRSHLGAANSRGGLVKRPKKEKPRLEPGTIRRVRMGPLFPGIKAKGEERTVLDGAKVFIRVGRQEISLAEVLKGRKSG
jgi:hypothetical protein